MLSLKISGLRIANGIPCVCVSVLALFAYLWLSLSVSSFARTIVLVLLLALAICFFFYWEILHRNVNEWNIFSLYLYLLYSFIDVTWLHFHRSASWSLTRSCYVWFHLSFAVLVWCLSFRWFFFFCCFCFCSVVVVTCAVAEQAYYLYCTFSIYLSLLSIKRKPTKNKVVYTQVQRRTSLYNRHI